ncbi:probable magnesium transporter NIPA3 isoform X5 [Gossypium arboreum]|uniref:probable magnesium transporter NIPA3 isoform X5 n=1 Tax=Gossypium arboreum TaxID=29729 RepID=UPI0022F19C00|nr:probable magnesium transporter NIPA3 isoform X5 [Gossypium arboreum]
MRSKKFFVSQSQPKQLFFITNCLTTHPIQLSNNSSYLTPSPLSLLLYILSADSHFSLSFRFSSFLSSDLSFLSKLTPRQPSQDSFPNSPLVKSMAAVRRWSEGMSSDNIKGLVLAISSSLFIGASFIVKKKGLKKAGASGVRAGVGGYSYLLEPLWWIGMITMVVGEIANFAAYAFAPAILVTPLGALSIIISAVLAHIILREKLHTFGILGCALCVVGSTTIVLHAPQERQIESVTEVWDLATETGFLFYTALVLTAVFILIFHFVPQYGQTHIMVYIGVCSLVGSISVMSVKALGIALKLTFSGMNQLLYPQTWAFTLVVASCVITQMNYLNKALQRKGD